MYSGYMHNYVSLWYRILFFSRYVKAQCTALGFPNAFVKVKKKYRTGRVYDIFFMNRGD